LINKWFKVFVMMTNEKYLAIWDEDKEKNGWK
jgi:hypothetical protein